MLIILNYYILLYVSIIFIVPNNNKTITLTFNNSILLKTKLDIEKPYLCSQGKQNSEVFEKCCNCLIKTTITYIFFVAIACMVH